MNEEVKELVKGMGPTLGGSQDRDHLQVTCTTLFLSSLGPPGEIAQPLHANTVTLRCEGPHERWRISTVGLSERSFSFRRCPDLTCDLAAALPQEVRQGSGSLASLGRRIVCPGLRIACRQQISLRIKEKCTLPSPRSSGSPIPWEV